MTHWTVLSQPGPVERGILAGLAPDVVVRHHVDSGVTLRALQGGSARADAPTIVLLHGRGHAAPTWAPILARLARRHAVLAFDLPGFGHSASRPWEGGDARAGLAFFADPIAQTLAGLGGPMLIVGHSLGAAVALATVLDGAVSPHALLLIGAMGLGTRVHRAARMYLAGDPERLARWQRPARRLVEALTGDTPSPAAALRRELLCVRGGRPEAAAAFRAMCPLLGEPFAFTSAELSSIRQRVVLLWGDRDEAFPLDVAHAAARVLPRAEVRVVAGGHSPHVEKPDVVSAVIEQLAEPG